MSPYYSDDSIALHHGSCLDVLGELPDASVEAVVTDPPYGLANTTPEKIAETVKRWMDGERDYLPTGKGFMGNPWDAFVPPVAVWDDCLRVLKPGGHVLAFAGSRTVDLMTLSLRLAGFDIRDSIAWLYGSGFPKSRACLKPAHEPIVVARKRPAPGEGLLNIDRCRVGSAARPLRLRDERPRDPGDFQQGARAAGETTAGRWPANVVLDESQAEVLGEPSRFMYVAKAPKSERPNVDGVAHPTVKPLALMRWLVRLVTPPGGTVLEPFAGSGTTIEAALLEGFNVIGIEREADYLPLIEARIARALGSQVDLFGGAA